MRQITCPKNNRQCLKTQKQRAENRNNTRYRYAWRAADGRTGAADAPVPVIRPECGE